MIEKIINRRIPQILGSYFIAGTSLVLFIEYLVEKYEFPIYLPTMSLIALIGILPSVLILAYFHGAPGKDEWTKIEKVGVPVNVLFIGIFILMGNNYNWWLDSVEIKIQEKPKRILISEITSNDKNMDILNKSIFNQNKPPDKLDILTEEEKNSIYDELISSLNMKNKNELLSYYTKYDLYKYYAGKGEAAPKYNYDYIRGFQNLDFQSETVMQDMMNLNRKYIGKEESMDRYMSNVQAELGYFPIIYRSSDKYAIYHLVARKITSITASEEDTSTSVNFNILPDYKIVSKDDIYNRHKLINVRF